MDLLKKHLPLLTRWSLAVCYIWFGGLKFFSGMSPAESLATGTIDHLFLGLLPSKLSLMLLAGWEVLVGIGLIIWVIPRFVITTALVHMALTFTPLFIYPEICFNHPPAGFSIVGQYILKNLVFVCAFIFIYPDSGLKKEL